jgi:hypothetical protein
VAPSIEAYPARLRELKFSALWALIEPLRGQNLACWCALDAPCHADTLLALAALDREELREWWAPCEDCGKPQTTTREFPRMDQLCRCGEELPPMPETSGWREREGADIATPAQAGGAHSAAEAVVDDMCRYNGLRGIGDLSKPQQLEWVRLLAKILDEYGVTADQARVAWMGWVVRNNYRPGIDPHYKSFPSELGVLLAGVKAGTITRETLKAEEQGKGNGRKRSGPGSTGEPTAAEIEERQRMQAALRAKQAGKGAAAAGGE